MIRLLLCAMNNELRMCYCDLAPGLSLAVTAYSGCFFKNADRFGCWSARSSIHASTVSLPF